MNGPFPPRENSLARAPEDTAAEWLARRHAGLTAAEAAEFDHWRAADPEHAAAFARLDRVWSDLNAPRRSGRATAILLELDRRDTRRTRRRQLARLSFAGLGGAVAALLFHLWPIREDHERPSAATVVIKRNRQTLADGSTVELNAQAEVALAFTATERRIRLLRGEALFDVVPDAGRPFIVVAGDIVVRAIGTAFAVRQAETSVDVLVTEGKVTIERHAPAPGAVPATPAASVLVTAGSRASVPSGFTPATAPALASVTPAEISVALAWRDKRLEFSGTPLLQAVELFNRHNRIQLSVADARTSARKITGIFWSDDPAGFARVLQIGLNIEARPAGDYLVLRER